ncbi:hypothetical protein, partial [Sutterella wadsworthensis]|uniref:hypothetical protein n=1 Tax=Sutterella wadsworthensis TaxID=40545 RepID=UPI003967A581
SIPPTRHPAPRGFLGGRGAPNPAGVVARPMGVCGGAPTEAPPAPAYKKYGASNPMEAPPKTT